MAEQRKPLEELVRELPPELQEEVRDFAAFLLEKRAKPSRRVPSFGWAGALRHLRDEYTSVELQHKIAVWRAGEE